MILTSIGFKYCFLMFYVLILSLFFEFALDLDQKILFFIHLDLRLRLSLRMGNSHFVCSKTTAMLPPDALTQVKNNHFFDFFPKTITADMISPPNFKVPNRWKRY